MKKLFVFISCVFIMLFAASLSCHAESTELGNYVSNSVQHPTKPYIYWSNHNTLYRVYVIDNSINTGTIFDGTSINWVQAVHASGNKVLVHERTGKLVEVVDDETLEVIKTITLSTGSYNIAVTDKYLFAGGRNGNTNTLYSYSIETGEQISSIQVSSNNYLMNIWVNVAQNSIYCLDQYNRKVTFNPTTGRFISKFDYTSNIVINTISPDGSFLVSARNMPFSYGGIIFSCNPTQSLDLKRLDSFPAGASPVCFDISGASKNIYVAGGSYPESFITQYSYPSLKITGFFTPSAYVRNLFFIDGKVFAVVADSDSEIYRLEKFNPSELKDICNPSYTPTTTSLTQEDGKIDLNDVTWNHQSVHANNSLYMVDANINKLFKFDYTNLTQTEITLPFQPSQMDTYNGDIYVYCGSSYMVYRFDGQTLTYKSNAVALYPRPQQQYLTQMKFGNDGNMYFAGTGYVYVYSPSDGKQLSEYRTSVNRTNVMVMSPAENVIYLPAGNDGTLKLTYSNGVLSSLYTISSLQTPIYTPVQISSDGKYLYSRWWGSSGDGLISECTNNSSTDLKTQATFRGLSLSMGISCYDSEHGVFYVPSAKTIAIVNPSLAEVTGYYRTKYEAQQTFCGNKLVTITSQEYGKFSLEIFDPSTYFVPKSSSLQGTDADSTLDVKTITKVISNEDMFYMIDSTDWKLYKIDYANRTKIVVNLPFQPFDISYYDGGIYVAYRNSDSIYMNSVYKYNAQTLVYQNKLKVPEAYFRAMTLGNDGYLYISVGYNIYGYSFETKQQISSLSHNYWDIDLLYTHPTENIIYCSYNRGMRGQVNYNNGVLSELQTYNSGGNSVVGLLPDENSFLTSNGNVISLQTNPYLQIQTLRNIGKTIATKNLAFEATGYVFWGNGNKIGIADRNPYYQRGSIATKGDVNWVFAFGESLYAITDQSGVYHIEKFDPSEAELISIVEIIDVSDLQYKAEYGGSVQLKPIVKFTDGTSMDIQNSSEYTSSDTDIVTVSSTGLLRVNSMSKTGTATVSITFAGFAKEIKVSSVARLKGITTSNGFLLPNFNADTKEYVISLPYGTTTVPDIKGQGLGTLLDIEVIPNTDLSESTIINVRYNTGVLADTYTASFVVREYIESVHPFVSYSSETQTYTATTDCGSILLTFSEDTLVSNGSIYIIDVDGNNIPGSPFRQDQLAGRTIVVMGTVANVRLQGYNNSQNDYGFRITDIIENPHTLTDITTSSGYISEPFSVVIKDYTVNLPMGIKTVPAIEGIFTHPSLSIDVISAATLSDSTVINVYNGATLIDTFTVNFYQPPFLESEHPYDLDTEQMQVYISEDNCGSISLTFSEDTMVNPGRDYIYIFNADGYLIPGSSFTGEELAGKTVTVMGNEVYIELGGYSGGGNSYYGYKVVNIVENPHSLINIVSSAGKLTQAFNVGTKEYIIRLPMGTIDVPDVEGVFIDENLTTQVIPADTLSDSTIINVLDGTNTIFDTYTVSFYVPMYMESDHPYANYINETKTYTAKTECDSISLTFSEETFVELYSDYIYITDANGNEIFGSPFTGSQLAGRTVTVPGRIVNIRLSSDSSATYFGYRVTNIVENQFDSVIKVTDTSGNPVSNLSNADNASVNIVIPDGVNISDVNGFVAYYDMLGGLLKLESAQISGDLFTGNVELNTNVKTVKIFLWYKKTMEPIDFKVIQ